jgi:hypothetical protein
MVQSWLVLPLRARTVVQVIGTLGVSAVVMLMLNPKILK